MGHPIVKTPSDTPAYSLSRVDLRLLPSSGLYSFTPLPPCRTTPHQQSPTTLAFLTSNRNEHNFFLDLKNNSYGSPYCEDTMGHSSIFFVTHRPPPPLGSAASPLCLPAARPLGSSLPPPPPVRPLDKSPKLPP
jgi:hypothetical protein